MNRRDLNITRAMLLVVLAGLSEFTTLVDPDVVIAQTRQDKPDIPAALRRGGLQEAARVSGGTYTLNWDIEYLITPQSLQQIVGQSDLVIVGEVIESRCHLSKRGEYITTDYKVVVQERLRGQLDDRSSTVLVSIVGGNVVFEHGLTATVATPGFRHPVNGERLLLFLNFVPPSADYVATAIRSYANGTPMYRLVFGNASVWGIPANESGTIVAKWLNPDSVARENLGKTVRAFLDEIRQTIADVERREATNAELGGSS